MHQQLSATIRMDLAQGHVEMSFEGKRLLKSDLPQWHLNLSHSLPVLAQVCHFDIVQQRL